MGSGRLALWGPAKLLDLFDRSLDIRQRAGSGSPVHDELKDVSIGHAMHATQIGHDDRDGAAHAGTAAHENPVVSMVTGDPLDRLIQRGRLGFAELFEWNSIIDDAGRRFRREFFGDQKDSADLSRRFFRLVDISHKECIRNLIHAVSIREDRLEVKQKGASTWLQ